MTRPARKAASELPPNNPDAERGALACILDAASAPAEQDSLLEQLRPGLFFDNWHAQVLACMKSLRAEKHAVCLVTLTAALEKAGVDVPGSRLVELSNAIVSWQLFPYHLQTLEETALRRWSHANAARLKEMARAESLTVDQLQELFAEIHDKAQGIGKPKRKPVEVVTVSGLLKENLPDNLGLVGDGDITRGYQGVTIIAGPPGSGKSLSVDSLVIAGALGKGFWFGRRVHCQFRTLVIQAENGKRRLKRLFQAMRENYPGVKWDDWVRYTVPPEGGLPFNRPEFRREIGRIIEGFKPDLVVIDPWTACAVEDTGKDVVDSLALVRSVFPPGDDSPALVIVAHTKKPRAEDRANKGRALNNSVMGSQALVSTARCVYVVLPFTDDIQDDRILLACSKMSDSDNPPADSVWHRRLGALFDASDDDPKDYWKEDNRNSGPWLTLEMVEKVLGRSTMIQSQLARRLADEYHGGKGPSSVHKWLKREPFASRLEEVGGMLRLKGCDE